MHNRDNWAKTVSKNKNVKIYVGALAAPSAGGSGYVDTTTLSNIALNTRSQFSSFGGVMLWDASQAYSASYPPSFASQRPLIIPLVYATRQRPLRHDYQERDSSERERTHDHSPDDHSTDHDPAYYYFADDYPAGDYAPYHDPAIFRWMRRCRRLVRDYCCACPSLCFSGSL